MRICIDARIIRDGYSGGTQQVVMGLATAFSQYATDDEFLFLVYQNHANWLKPYLKGRCRLLEVPAPAGGVGRIVRKLNNIGESLLYRLNPQKYAPPLDTSDGTIEREQIDVMHFVLQSRAFVTDVPSIYHPWDLQHIHLPAFFTPQQIHWRNHVYRSFCERSTLVSVASQWIKDDVVAQYAIDPEKIAVIPMGSIVDSYAMTDPHITQQKYQLPEQFLFYPAQTWQHKNHIRLLQSLAEIRDTHNITMPLICTGFRNAYYREIEKTVQELGLESQIRFLDYVPEADLKAIYHLATALVFASLFEGWGLPITEAFNNGLPVVSSNVTSLPEQIGDAGLLFDPYDIQQISDRLMQIWSSSELREQLAQRGYERAKQMTWEHTAQQFYECYRRVVR